MFELVGEIVRQFLRQRQGLVQARLRFRRPVGGQEEGAQLVITPRQRSRVRGHVRELVRQRLVDCQGAAPAPLGLGQAAGVPEENAQGVVSLCEVVLAGRVRRVVNRELLAECERPEAALFGLAVPARFALDNGQGRLAFSLRSPNGRYRSPGKSFYRKGFGTRTHGGFLKGSISGPNESSQGLSREHSQCTSLSYNGSAPTGFWRSPGPIPFKLRRIPQQQTHPALRGFS